MTKASLLAKATSLPARIAAKVGGKPIAPTRAAMTISASSCVAIACSPVCAPYDITRKLGQLLTQLFCILFLGERDQPRPERPDLFDEGSQVLACRKATTQNFSGKRPTISRVDTPMEPVEPRTAIRFIFSTLSSGCISEFSLNNGILFSITSIRTEQDEEPSSSACSYRSSRPFLPDRCPSQKLWYRGPRLGKT